MKLKNGPDATGPAFFAASADALKPLKVLKDFGVNLMEKVGTRSEATSAKIAVFDSTLY